MRLQLTVLAVTLICTIPNIYAQDMLEKYRWRNRIILLFTSGQSNETLQKQDSILKTDSAGIKERDLVIIHSPLNASSNFNQLRDRYDVRDSFTFVLIGKDGEEKLISYSAVTLEKLFGLIDSMPMRRSEMEKDQ